GDSDAILQTAVTHIHPAQTAKAGQLSGEPLGILVALADMQIEVFPLARRRETQILIHLKIFGLLAKDGADHEAAIGEGEIERIGAHGSELRSTTDCAAIPSSRPVK